MDGAKTAAKAVGALVLVLLVFVSGFAVSDCQSDSRYNNLIAELADKDAEVTAGKNKVLTIEQLLTTERAVSEEERGVLLATISELRDKPTEVRYIVKTETVLVPADPVVVTQVLPSSHDFILENGVQVASFDVDASNEAPQYTFETHELTLRGTLALGEKDSAISLEMSSSSAPDNFFPVPVDLTTVRIRKQPLFEPHLGLGITGGVGANTVTGVPTGDLTASLFLSFLHPVDNLDVIQVRVGGNPKNIRVGLDPISYNVGAHIPIFTDLWLAPGFSVGLLDQSVTGDITLGTKF